MKTNITRILTINLILFLLYSCKKDFLAVRPDIKKVKLSAVDCQALLDNTAVMNSLYPHEGDVSCDDYYFETDAYNSIYDEYEKKLYLWDNSAQQIDFSIFWLNPYNAIYNANLVIQTLEKNPGNLDRSTINTLIGTGLFYRAYISHQLAQIYCNVYTINTPNNSLGIPIRTSPDIELKAERGTVESTYTQIIKDLKQAASLLPLQSSIKTRPNRVAAYACLARTYLSMQDYKNALLYADSTLYINNNLMDYNILDKTVDAPFEKFNSEVIFYATKPQGYVYPDIAMVDTVLYKSYGENDLRKVLFFKPNSTTGYGNSGNYSGDKYIWFSGIATDEIYLIKAESLVRNGKALEALHELNILLQSRWKTGTFVDYNSNSPNQVLKLILDERRKELIFRGTRWTDLKRLNLDANFAMTLKRKINNLEYLIAPNDLRYSLLLPKAALDNTNYLQNPR